jgi:hypothetical protein
MPRDVHDAAGSSSVARAWLGKELHLDSIGKFSTPFIIYPNIPTGRPYPEATIPLLPARRNAQFKDHRAVANLFP